MRSVRANITASFGSIFSTNIYYLFEFALYPRDYDRAELHFLALFHLLWLFPWAMYFPAAAQAQTTDRWTAVDDELHWRSAGPGFYSYSSRSQYAQEYYSMPCYPALALLLGCAMVKGFGSDPREKDDFRQLRRPA